MPIDPGQAGVGGAGAALKPLRRFFHAELDHFRSQLSLMSERAIESVQLAAKALLDRDDAACARVLAGDDAIDDLEIQIDNEGLRYVNLRSPVARELRLVLVGMKLGHDLERVGDEACTMAKRTRSILSSSTPDLPLLRIPEMAEEVLRLMRESIGCFLVADVEKARTIPLLDRHVDALHRENYRGLVQAMEQQPRTHLEPCLDLLFISKSLERVADHAANLAEETVFLYSGEDIRHSMRPEPGSTRS